MPRKLTNSPSHIYDYKLSYVLSENNKSVIRRGPGLKRNFARLIGPQFDVKVRVGVGAGALPSIRHCVV